MKFNLPENFILTEEPITTHLIGLGGSGGEMLDNLVKIHQVLIELGHNGLDIHLWDFDTVSSSNIGRTRFSRVDVGQYKTDVLAGRYSAFYGIKIHSHPVAFDLNINIGGSILISCTDSAKFRCQLSNSFNQYSDCSATLWLDLGNETETGQYILGAIGENVLTPLPTIYDLFQKDLEEKSLEKMEDTPTCSLLEAIKIQSLFINKTLATLSADMLYTLLKEGSINFHGEILNLKTGENRRIPISEAYWEFLRSA